MVESGEPPRVLLASGNPAKLAALRRAIGDAAIVDPLPEVSGGDEEEAEGDLAAIAAAKAERASLAAPGEFVIATDGGLLVPALGARWNPRRTRRFAGPAATDRERAEALLALAAGLRGEERRIGWREALAVAHDGRIVARWTAEDTPGLLATDVDPAWVDGGGFWVPAVWVCPEFGGRRLAELSAPERAARDDHWARLGRELRRFLAASAAGDRSNGLG
jgi:inosine/xanthosine triphosphate pyrophosphatase family protein